jgi:hypothetical protein
MLALPPRLALARWLVGRRANAKGPSLRLLAELLVLICVAFELPSRATRLGSTVRERNRALCCSEWTQRVAIVIHNEKVTRLTDTTCTRVRLVLLDVAFVVTCFPPPDNISYALRGCILIELALRRRIAVVKDPSRRRLALGDRLIEVIDDRQTGETILDEALKMIKSSEKYGTAAWVDLMSGQSQSLSCNIWLEPRPVTSGGPLLTVVS